MSLPITSKQVLIGGALIIAAILVAAGIQTGTIRYSAATASLIAQDSSSTGCYYMPCLDAPGNAPHVACDGQQFPVDCSDPRCNFGECGGPNAVPNSQPAPLAPTLCQNYQTIYKVDDQGRTYEELVCVDKTHPLIQEGRLQPASPLPTTTPGLLLPRTQPLLCDEGELVCTTEECGPDNPSCNTCQCRTGKERPMRPTSTPSIQKPGEEIPQIFPTIPSPAQPEPILYDNSAPEISFWTRMLRPFTNLFSRWF